MTPEEAGRSGRNRTILALALLLALSVFLLTMGRNTLDGPRAALGIALLWLCAYPAWRFFRDGASTIPFLPAMSLVYFLSYGLPAFNRVLRVRSHRPDPSSVLLALGLATAGQLLLLLAFYGAPLPKLPKLKLNLDLKGRAMPMIVIGFFTLSARLVLIRGEAQATTRQLLVFVGYLPVVMLSGLLLLTLRKQLSRLNMLLGSVLLIAVLLVDLSTGAVAEPAFTVADLIFVFVAERKRLPILTIGLAALLMIPILGTKQEFRRIVDKQNIQDTARRVDVFGELIANVFQGGSSRYEVADEVAESRIDHLSAFSYVVAKTPATVPYWAGETYQSFFWSFIPRFLVPDKPRKELGQAYGHRYGFISRYDHGTSINLEQTVEMYANFGIPGVLIGMLLMGLLYKSLYAVLNHPDGGDGAIMIAAAMFRLLLNIESDFSLVFGGVVQNLLPLYLVLWLLARERPPAASPAVS